MNNFLKLEIKAKLENVAVVRVAISSFVSNLEITVDENNPMEEIEVQEILEEDKENLKGDE